MMDEAPCASCSFVSSVSLHRVHTAIKISGVNRAYKQTTEPTRPLTKTGLTLTVAAQWKDRQIFMTSELTHVLK